MKKQLITAILLIGILWVAGCGRTQEEVDTYAEQYKQYGTIVDTGTLKAVCPGGWNPVDAYDYSVSTSEKAKDVLEFVKGASSVNDGTPFIRIQAHDPEAETVYPDRNLYTDVTDLTTFTAGTYSWDGFTGQINGERFAWLYSHSDGDSLEVWLFMHTGEELQAFVTDSDVFLILESLRVE